MKERLLKYLPWLILAFGALLRIGQFIFNRSVTEGEAALALNIIGRSYADLLKPLDLVQAAPYGFLVIQRSMLIVFGNSDFSLRIVPQFAGLVSLFVFWTIAKKLLGTWGAAIGLLIFSAADQLIYFASELKQYSTDVVVGLIITGLTISVLKAGFNRRNFLGLALCCGLGIWFSHPAFFFLGAAGLAILIRAIKNRTKEAWPFWIALGLIFLASFAADYALSLRYLSASRDFLNFWQPAFMPLPPRILADLKWFGYVFARVFKNPAGFPIYLLPLAAMLFILGIIRFFKKSPGEAWSLVLPALLALAASGFHKYPFEGRLLLFLVPGMILFIAAGFEFLVGDDSRVRRFVSVIAALILILPVTGLAGYRLIRPRQPEELRPVMRFLQVQYRPGDAIYVYYAALNGFNYYGRQLNFHPDRVHPGVESRSDPSGYLRDLKRMTGQPRAWILFSHIVNWGGVDEERMFLDYLERLGRRLGSFRASGASVYLYDLQ